MPKPFAHLTGNGCHFHMSLWDGDTNLFARDRGDDLRNLGPHRPRLQLHRRPEDARQAYIALSAPTVSSYKRLVIGAPTSGATGAPAYATYGWNNRTMMLRIPDAGRIEDRTVDGSCNPYLAATAILAAGLDGIEREHDPGDPTAINMYETSEADRRELGIEVAPGQPAGRDPRARGRRGASHGLRLGRRRGLRRLLHPLQAARRQTAHEQITQWELDRYPQLF